MARFRQFTDKDVKQSEPERRRHIRYAGDGLLVMLDGRMLPAADISLGGVRIIANIPRACGAVLPLRIIPVVEEVMKLGKAAEAEAQVVGFGHNGLRMVFLGWRPAMARLVKTHARRQRRNYPFPQAFIPRGD
ncbi:MAG: hypothetical protein AB7G62_04640 [Magnetospirillum sp.]